MKGKERVFSILTIAMIAVFTVTLILTVVLQNLPRNGAVLNQETEAEEAYAYIDGEAIESDKVYPMPKSLTYRSVQSYKEFTLRVTVLPEDADNKQVDFKAEFKDPQSAWARGKSVNDYFGFTQSEDGGAEVKVACKNPFGEQIIFTATSRSNSEVTATCTVDYAQSIKEVSLSLTDGSNVTPIPLGNSALNSGRYEAAVVVNSETGGTGGVIALNYRTDEAYTIPLGEVTETVNFSGGSIQSGYYGTQPQSFPMNAISSPIGKEIRFNRSIFRDYAENKFDVMSGTYRSWYNESTDLETMFNEIQGSEDAYRTLFNVTVEISGDSYTYTGYSKIIWSNCTVSVKSLSFDHSQAVLTQSVENPFA